MKKDLAKLKTDWYKKLKDDGFEDIEYRDGSLKSSSFRLTRRRNLSKESMDAVQSYYIMATHFLNEFNFANPLELIIWTYHAEGLSIRKIHKALRSAGIRKSNKTVQDIVVRLRNLMKARYLRP